MNSIKKVIIVVFCITLSSCVFFTSYGRDCERAEIAYKAYKSDKTVREIAIKEKILDKNELDKILDPKTMIKPKH